MPLQQLDHLSVADRLQGVGVDGDTGGTNPLHLLHQAGREKPVCARLDSSIEL